jgi:hypothetical protein
MRSVFVFYGRFAAAYGTCWFVLLLVAVLTQSHIDTGAFGLFGFPLIGVCYATIRIWVPNLPATGTTGRGFDVIAARPVVGLDDETAEEILARQLGDMKTFIVKGVDKRTLNEKTLRIAATTRESAGVKAELEGLIVTVVYEEKEASTG